MLAAWHDTNSNLSVENRIKVSMQNAAVSIAITTITDITAFLAGAVAPLPAVSLHLWVRNSKRVTVTEIGSEESKNRLYQQ